MILNLEGMLLSGWVNEFLSWGGFVPLSRLTYCSYLIHIPILTFLSGVSRGGTYYTSVDLVSMGISTCIFVVFVTLHISQVLKSLDFAVYVVCPALV